MAHGHDAPRRIHGQPRSPVDLPSDVAHGPGHVLRRILLVLLLVVVLAAAAGAFGVRSGRVSDSAGGYTLTLVYPRVARAGLDVPWHATITHQGGFDEDIVLAVTADWFTIIETQGFLPSPDSETSDGEFVYLTFLPPPDGEVFRVDFDSYIQPASQLGRSAELRLLVGGQPVVSVAYRTWLVP
ncbi:MAG: hypothetical protein H0T85_09325 [Geodermatophilaceae bacterium]|nr:hypothetical protein [Geodermatophilaceae bacterium]